MVDVYEAVGAELGAEVGGDGGAVDDGFFEGGEGGVILLGDVAHEATCEGVSGAGGVDDFHHGVGGGGEDLVVVEEEAAVFAFFGADDFGAHLLDFAGGADEVVVLGELDDFFVVDDEAVDFFEDVGELVVGDIDPQVHGVQGDEFVLGLLQGHHLDGRVSVSAEKVRRVLSDLR